MQTITIEANNLKDAKIFFDLAKRLDCKIRSEKKTKPKTNNKELAKLFKSLADRGTLAEAIPDPVAWQKEIRKDRKFPGR